MWLFTGIEEVTGEEAISVPVEHAAKFVGEPIQMDDVQPEMTTDPPLEPKPLVLESVAQTKEAAAISLGLKPEPLPLKSIVRQIHTGTAQPEAPLTRDLSSELESSALEPHI